MSNIEKALSEVRTAVESIAALQALGWDTEWLASAVTQSSRGGGSHLYQTLRALASQPTLSIMTGSIGATTITLRSSAGVWRVDTADKSALIEAVPSTLRDQAVSAAAGNVEAAAALPAIWSARVEWHPASPLSAFDSETDWHVALDTAALVNLLESVPPWEHGPLLDGHKPAVYLFATAPPDSHLALPRALFAPLEMPAAALAERHRSLHENTPSNWRAPLPTMAHPDALVPVSTTGSTMEELSRICWTSATTSAWLALATDVLQDQDRVEAAFFGLQRVTHEVPKVGIKLSEDQMSASLEMFSWADQPRHLDQRLAIEQVASFYHETAPWRSASDVLAAAKAVAKTLRRNEVSEVLQARRSARSLAIDAAHKTVDLTSGVVRSVAERCVVALLGVGGVIAAESGNALTQSQALSLRSLAGIFLLALALWAAFVEGPPTRAPIASLRKDIKVLGDLLTPAERREVLNLESVKGADRRAAVVQWAVPVAYAVAALIAIAAPSNF